jgi:predicted RNase H-like HicB family nuclease
MAKIAKRATPKRAIAVRKKRRPITKPSLGFTVRKHKSNLSHAHLMVAAGYDPEAGVWYIAASSLPGLHLEADTYIELYEKLPGAIEDLLEGSGEREVLFEFTAPDHKNLKDLPGRVRIAA